MGRILLLLCLTVVGFVSARPAIYLSPRNECEDSGFISASGEDYQLQENLEPSLERTSELEGSSSEPVDVKLSKGCRPRLAAPRTTTEIFVPTERELCLPNLEQSDEKSLEASSSEEFLEVKLSKGCRPRLAAPRTTTEIFVPTEIELCEPNLEQSDEKSLEASSSEEFVNVKLVKGCRPKLASPPKPTTEKYVETERELCGPGTTTTQRPGCGPKAQISAESLEENLEGPLPGYPAYIVGEDASAPDFLELEEPRPVVRGRGNLRWDKAKMKKASKVEEGPNNVLAIFEDPVQALSYGDSRSIENEILELIKGMVGEDATGNDEALASSEEGTLGVFPRLPKLPKGRWIGKPKGKKWDGDIPEIPNIPTTEETLLTYDEASALSEGEALSWKLKKGKHGGKKGDHGGGRVHITPPDIHIYFNGSSGDQQLSYGDSKSVKNKILKLVGRMLGKGSTRDDEALSEEDDGGYIEIKNENRMEDYNLDPNADDVSAVRVKIKVGKKGQKRMKNQPGPVIIVNTNQRKKLRGRGGDGGKWWYIEDPSNRQMKDSGRKYVYY